MNISEENLNIMFDAPAAIQLGIFRISSYLSSSIGYLFKQNMQNSTAK